MKSSKSIKLLSQVMPIVVLCLILAACGSTRGLRKIDRRIVQRSDLVPFLDQQQGKKAWYNITIKFGKNENSGQLLVKQTNDSLTRVLFTTPVGFKIFDFAITPDSFKILACIDPLKKKSILKIMEKDFRLMFCPYTKDKVMRIYKFVRDTNIVVYRTKNSGKSYYWVNNQSKNLLKIDNHSFPIGGARINFDYFESDKLPKIYLKQKGINLSFELVPVTQ